MNEVVVTEQRAVRKARHLVESDEQAVALTRTPTFKHSKAGLEHLNPADLDAGRAVLMGRSSLVWIVAAKAHLEPDDAP